MVRRAKSVLSGFARCLLLIAVGLCVAAADEVDLELVLAMDGSGSISPSEYVLQLEGTASAFEDPGLQQAILSGPTGRVAVSMMIWSDAAFPKIKSPWFLLDSADAANNFAAFVRLFHQHTGRKFGIGGGGTGIGDGIRVALEMIAENRFEGLRRVIDVSGDGVETDPWFDKGIQLPQARALALARGVQVNGLPILSIDFPQLDFYYQTEVIIGPGAFIEVADGFEDFARAIRQKLWREISHRISWNLIEDAPKSPTLASLRTAGAVVPKFCISGLIEDSRQQHSHC